MMRKTRYSLLAASLLLLLTMSFAEQESEIISISLKGPASGVQARNEPQGKYIMSASQALRMFAPENESIIYRAKINRNPIVGRRIIQAASIRLKAMEISNFSRTKSFITESRRSNATKVYSQRIFDKIFPDNPQDNNLFERRLMHVSPSFILRMSYIAEKGDEEDRKFIRRQLADNTDSELIKKRKLFFKRLRDKVIQPESVWEIMDSTSDPREIYANLTGL